MKVRPRLDPIVHAPKRLQLCAMLTEVDEGEFAALRDALEVSDSVLSKQLKVLEDAGYVTLNKTTIDSRVRTRARLTKAGRRAFAAHVAALQDIVAGAAAIAPGHRETREPVAATRGRLSLRADVPL
jgi:DNA-binding MarR family transcriptional regulator